MTAISDRPGLLRDGELVVRNGVYHRAGDEQVSEYRRRWEDEAEEDHVRSAIAAGATTKVDYASLTGKIAPVWDRIPRGLDLGTVLEIGAGYGRIPLYLARERGVEWAAYIALDISETMLHRLVEYRDEFTPGETPLYLVCASADELPLQDESVDTVLTSVVFLHMGKSFVARAVAEIARVLRPGGQIVFDASFPNARNPVQPAPAGQAEAAAVAELHEVLDTRRDRAPARVERAEREDGAARDRPLRPRARAAPPRAGARARRAPAQPARRAAPRTPARRHGDDLPRLQPGDRRVRALVTGGGGFVGSHLVERLEADGHEVVAARRRDYDLTS